MPDFLISGFVVEFSTLAMLSLTSLVGVVEVLVDGSPTLSLDVVVVVVVVVEVVAVVVVGPVVSVFSAFSGASVIAGVTTGEPLSDPVLDP